MQAMLLRRWFRQVIVAGSLSVAIPAVALAGWPWSRPAPAPAIPVGPPIYTPTTPTVVGYQPAAAVAPTLGAPAATIVTPAPAVVAPAIPATCGHCAPAPRVTGYVPPNYHTSFMQVPTTTYRPVASVDPATGLPINAVAPCTTTGWQARRVPTSWWGGLWPASSPTPTVVAYTPATIAAYPPPRVVTNYAPTVIVPRNIPAPVVTTYAPPQTQIVTNYAPAPVVTQYAPAPAPVVTQFAPAPVSPPPVISQPVPAPALQAAPTSPCPPEATTPPGPGVQQGTPADVAPSLHSPGGYQGGNIYPQGSVTSGDAASIAPRLEANDINGRTIRSYPPAEYDNLPVVPVQPPTERRVIETPRIEGPNLQSPQGSSSTIRSPVPFIPFSRPSDRPVSTPAPERRLRLVPDPDAEKLELRKDEIPNLIKPGDRTTQIEVPRAVASMPVSNPSRPVVMLKPQSSNELPLVPASLAAPDLDDSGWRSVAK